MTDAAMAIVTLTSDFGTADGYVGAMKGVIFSRAPDARVVDIAHDIRAYDIAAGAYALAQAARYFPPGTIHVAVVDPGVGTERRAVIASDGQCFYIGPDNGLLTLAVPEPAAVHAIETEAFVRRERSSTFHGRDIFAAAAGALAAGLRAGDAGPRVTRSPLLAPLLASAPAPDGPDAGIAILHIDSFGNLITDCPAGRVAPETRIRVPGTVIHGLSQTFAAVERGQLVAYIGSAGTVEIAVREGSAAERLGLGPGDTIELI